MLGQHCSSTLEHQQHSYNTVLNDKRNVELVLIRNAGLAMHSNQNKKSVPYGWRMMMGALSHQHSYNIVLNKKIDCGASVNLQFWPDIAFETL